MNRTTDLQRVSSRTLRVRLAAYDARARRFGVFDGLAVVVSGITAILLLILFLAWLLKPGMALCAICAVVFWAAAAVGGALVLGRGTRRRGAEALAFDIERRSGGFSDALTSAVQFAIEGAPAAGTSAELHAETIAAAEARLSRVDPTVLLDAADLRPWALRAGGVIMVLLAVLLLAPRFCGVALGRTLLFTSTPWPTRVRLAFVGEGGEARYVPRGAAVRIHVRVDPTGEIPERVRLAIDRPGRGGGETRWMASVDRHNFTADMDAVNEALVIRVRGGDATLGPQRILPVERPVVTGLGLTCTAPAYIGARPFAVALDTDAPGVPAESRINVAVRADRHVAQFECRVEPAAGTAGRPFVLTHKALGAEQSPPFEVAVRHDLTLRFSVADAHGIRSAPPTVVRLRAIQDEKPTVKLKLDGVRDVVTPDAWFDVVATARDDHGVAELALTGDLRATNGGNRFLDVDQQVAPVERGRGASLTRTVDLALLKPMAGELAELRAWAKDNDAVAGPKRSDVDTLSLKVLSPADFLSVMLVRQQTFRNQIDKLVDGAESVQARLAGGAAPAKELRTMIDAQQAGARSAGSVAAGFGAILNELLHNRIIKQNAYERYTQSIVVPLEGLAGPEGGLTKLAAALSTSGTDGAPKATAQAGEVVRVLKDVRARMLLLERYAGLIATVEDLIDRQGKIIRQTGK